MSIRDDMVALVKSYQDCGVSHNRAKYLDLVGPNETASIQSYMALPTTSGCALAVRGLWRKLGLKHSILSSPYRIGHAVSDVVAIAKSFDAWVTPQEGDMPGPGDSVLVGGGPADGGVEHVYTVVESNAGYPDGFEIVSIDGGQKDELRNQVIAQRHREWAWQGNSHWDTVDGATDPGAYHSHRRVIGYANIEKLVFG